MSVDHEALTRQVVELQSQVAFQEDALRSLDEAVAQQQQEILVLRRQLELLLKRQQEQAAQQDAGMANMQFDEKPPHY